MPTDTTDGARVEAISLAEQAGLAHIAWHTSKTDIRSFNQFIADFAEMHARREVAKYVTALRAEREAARKTIDRVNEALEEVE
jgi:hypothetical protein